MIDLDFAANIILTFFIFSFGGWLFEGAISLFRDHELVNRGFFNGPYCPIYGEGAMLFLLIMHWTDRAYSNILPRGSWKSYIKLAGGIIATGH